MGFVDGETAGRLDVVKAKCHAPKSRWDVVEVELSVARRHDNRDVVGDGLLYGCRAWIKLGQSSSGSLVASKSVAVRYVRRWYTAATRNQVEKAQASRHLGRPGIKAYR